MQASILEEMEPEKAADLIEEMAPDQAADVLSELPEQAAGEILDEMEPETKTEVTELLEFPPDSAGGLMNSDYVAVPVTATVEEALGQIREHEDLLDTLTTVYMVDAQGRLAGGIPLARLLLADRMNAIGPLGADQATPSVTVSERQDRIIEQFDKYNLLALPVVDGRGLRAGAARCRCRPQRRTGCLTICSPRPFAGEGLGVRVEPCDSRGFLHFHQQHRQRRTHHSLPGFNYTLFFS